MDDLQEPKGNIEDEIEDFDIEEVAEEEEEGE